MFLTPIETKYIIYTQNSQGRFLSDSFNGPNAVEFISWGLIQDGIRGPNGHYKIYAKGFRTIGRTLYNLAVLESPNQDWKYLNGELSNNKNQLVYRFNINSNHSSSLNSGLSTNFSEVFIYNGGCEFRLDIDCNCACYSL
jgi:hypothetical protein